MRRWFLGFLLRNTPFRALWLGTLTISMCIAIGSIVGVWILRLQEPLTEASGLKRSSSPWGRELKVVQRAFHSTEAQEPWGLEEIKWFVAGSFRNLSAAQKRELVKAIYDVSVEYGLAPQLILSVILVESDGNPLLESPKGALGLMQIMPSVGEKVASETSIKWRERETLTHPATNVRLGAHYLFQLLQRYEDLTLALCAYWLGPTRVDQLLLRNDPLPVQYAEKVLMLLENL